MVKQTIFSGLGGEKLRDYINDTPEEYLKICTEHAKKTDISLEKATERLLQKTINKISNEFDIDINSKEICRTIYAETRNRYHFGKLAVEEYFSNKFLLMPFFDPELNKLKLCTKEYEDYNLLFALIYLRYCPELLNFKFEGNRKINEKTLDYAQKINEISPFTNKKYSYISGLEIDENCLNKYYDINQEYIRWEAMVII